MILRVGTFEFRCFPVGVKDWIPLRWRRALGGRCESWRAARDQARLLRSLRGDTVECNICGWHGARFADDQWHRGTVCPVCRSQVRHRMFAALLDGKSDIAGSSEAELLAGKTVLHFAPERQLRDRIKRSARRYITADFDRGDCDLKLDMSSMPTVAESSFEAVIACDVLEHVPDDRAAMRELHRVLRPGGYAILTVPQKDPPASTDEDPGLTDPLDREKFFGQKDHVRMFGDDFADRLAAAGFEVQAVSADDFAEQSLLRHVLLPPAKNPHPLATNRRRIYLARKRAP